MTENNEESPDVKQEWLKDDPKEDHRIISRALKSPLRRKLMKFIGPDSEKKFEEIAEKFDLEHREAKRDLGYLEEAEIVEKTKDDPLTYKLSSRGRDYLRNVEKIE